MTNWTLFSNHGHVLVCLARDPQSRLRDVAAEVGITERAVQKIVRDLQGGDMLSITKDGRRNRYRIHRKSALRHDLEAHCSLGDLLDVLDKEPAGDQKPTESQVAAKPESQPIEARPEKSKPAKASLSKIIERQQGSLF